ncbi:MAG TPA: tripartite tricarboxylate transporter permease, partial [Paracoccaceae bacterium]|nr:tripartite tricarboxylate transporter permease [Paracoccaceae bacterium]
SSIVGAGICFAITPTLARLTRIPFGIIAAPLILIMVIGAYQATSTMGDVFLLFALGAVGWMMKHADWPRAPALVGFVLAGPMEQYFWLTNQIHGWSWLTRPGVLIIGSIIVIPLVMHALRWVRARARGEKRERVAAEAAAASQHPVIEMVLAGMVTVVFAYAIWEMTTFNPTSRLMPGLALLPGLPLAAWVLFRAIRGYAPQPDAGFREPTILMVLIGYAVAVWAVGFSLPTVALLAWMLVNRAGMRLWTAAIYGAAVFGVAHLLFNMLRGDVPVGAIIPLY